MQDQNIVVYVLLNEVVSKPFCGSGGIRTHASEETGALNQRLRPLGHATVDRKNSKRSKSYNVTAIINQTFLIL